LSAVFRDSIRRSVPWAAALTLAFGPVGQGRARAGGEQSQNPAAAAPSDSVTITAVEGPSTLHHLGRTIENSSMGWTGAFAASPLPEPTRLAGAEQLPRPFVMDGADLYRVSCRACHKADGSGAPPEINSLIGPVRSASVEWQTQRMKELGRQVDMAMTRQVAAETDADLRKRLKVGGHSMPAFGHLSDDEITVLRAYLDELAGVPGADRRPRHLTVPVARVGELIAKGTCHICHDAAGGEPSRQTTALSRIIPSLASIPHQKTIYDFVQKVTKGMPVPLSASGISSRGRMPVFNYFSEREAAAAYLYLIMYPPG